MTLKRTELIERLKNLAESEPPNDLAMGACCYTSTSMSSDSTYKYRLYLERIRNQGVSAELIRTNGEFHLEINYSDQSEPVRIKLGEPFDLELMALLLQGKDRYKTRFDSEVALIDKVVQLMKLFGIKPEELPEVKMAKMSIRGHIEYKKLQEEEREKQAKNRQNASEWLHSVNHSTDIEYVKSLISQGADVNAKNKSGWTPLHTAAAYKSNGEVLEYLLVNGADVNATNDFGETPLDLARTNEARYILRKAMEASKPTEPATE